MLKPVTPHQAAQMIKDGALLVDIREADEHAQERPAGAAHHPLSRLAANGPAREMQRPVIFHCRSGGRTDCNAAVLAAAAGGDAYVLAGGLDAWKAAGLPVQRGRPAKTAVA